MKRETKINIVFAVLLVALVAPGGVILFKKKSQPGERAIGSPDPVRTTTAWMDPYPAGNVERLAPVLALQWVGALTIDGVKGDWERVHRPGEVAVVGAERPMITPGHVGEAKFYGQNPSGNADKQVMSEHRWFQVVSKGKDGDRSWWRIIVWDADTRGSRGSFSARVKGSDQAEWTDAKVDGVHEVNMPIDVRHELQEAGYVMPPEVVTVLEVVARDVKVIELRYSTGKVDVVTLP